MEKQLKSFSKYQVFVIVILALTVFSVVLDFMVLSPLGYMMIRVLKISPAEFALVVSAYALSAGAAGFLSAGFADKFDRKKLLLFFYMGFILGTLFCALAQTFPILLLARIVTGIFGGVISSISFAIITDLFAPEQRGRVMGFVQSSFALSQVMGVPLGLYLANKFDWHMPFFTIVGFSLIIVTAIYVGLKPVNAHLKIKSEKNAIGHLFHTLANRTYLKGFAALSLLSMGGFLLMPFSSPFLVNNLHIPEFQLPLLYMFTGICTLATGPIVGRLADRYGKIKLFFWGSILTAVMVLYYTQMEPMNFGYVVLINCLLFIGVSARLISGSALMTLIPKAADRGAYMGINSSIQQISGGIGSMLAGLVIVQGTNNELQNYDVLGYITVGMLFACLYLMWIINGIITKSENGQI